MSKTVCIISASPRTNSNSDRLAKAFAQGAWEAGHTVQEVRLREHAYEFCQGCLACTRTGKCVLQDDAGQIVQMMHDANVLVFATPIYYYEMSGQLKTMLDRANPLYGSDYKFQDVYMLSTAAERKRPAQIFAPSKAWKAGSLVLSAPGWRARSLREG